MQTNEHAISKKKRPNFEMKWHQTLKQSTKKTTLFGVVLNFEPTKKKMYNSAQKKAEAEMSMKNDDYLILRSGIQNLAPNTTWKERSFAYLWRLRRKG